MVLKLLTYYALKNVLYFLQAIVRDSALPQSLFLSVENINLLNNTLFSTIGNGFLMFFGRIFTSSKNPNHTLCNGASFKLLSSYCFYTFTHKRLSQHPSIQTSTPCFFFFFISIEAGNTEQSLLSLMHMSDSPMIAFSVPLKAKQQEINSWPNVRTGR